MPRSILPPAVAICETTAPTGFADVVVQDDHDTVVPEGRLHGVKDVNGGNSLEKGFSTALS